MKCFPNSSEKCTVRALYNQITNIISNLLWGENKGGRVLKGMGQTHCVGITSVY